MKDLRSSIKDYRLLCIVKTLFYPQPFNLSHHDKTDSGTHKRNRGSYEIQSKAWICTCHLPSIEIVLPQFHEQICTSLSKDIIPYFQSISCRSPFCNSNEKAMKDLHDQIHLRIFANHHKIEGAMNNFSFGNKLLVLDLHLTYYCVYSD